MNTFILNGNSSDAPIADRALLRLSNDLPSPVAGRVPIKHLLIGSPPAVRITIHRLHVLGYANATDWSSLLVLPDQPLLLTPKPGDVMASLIKYLNLESR